MQSILKDKFGRIVNNLRISVTDRCNFRCTYCMPEEGMVWLEENELLSFEEIARLTKIFSELGVTKIRLTGGEPLMRKDLHILVEKISHINAIRDIALTTNGFFLAEQAEQLVNAGISRFTVSCDSLNAETFETLTRRNYLHKVFEALNVIEQFGIRPIKINTVLIRGINDNEIEEFAQLARSKPYITRFIEFMPIGKDDGWTIDKVVPTKEVIQRINATGKKLVRLHSHLTSQISNHIEPAERYKFEDGVGEIGFISSVSEPFCNSCNRVRITSDGKFRTCLFSLVEKDLKFLLRNNASDNEIKEAIVNAVLEKEEGHLINQQGFIRPKRTMSQIGG